MVNGLPDATRVVFDDERVVANAGVLLSAVLAGRLGIEAWSTRGLIYGVRAGAANPGHEMMTLVSAMTLGADCIEDCDVLRGSTRAVLGHRVAAPSTLGTFLREFTFGHVRQLDKVLAESDKQGAGYGYAGKRGYHPILATRAGTGEVLYIRARKGSAHVPWRAALRRGTHPEGRQGQHAQTDSASTFPITTPQVKVLRFRELAIHRV